MEVLCTENGFQIADESMLMTDGEVQQFNRRVCNVINEKGVLTLGEVVDIIFDITNGRINLRVEENWRNEGWGL